MTQAKQLRMELAARLREIRTNQFGHSETAVTILADQLGIPEQTWMNFEDGVTMPAEILLHLLTLTGVNSHWLLTGTGDRYARSRNKAKQSCRP